MKLPGQAVVEYALIALAVLIGMALAVRGLGALFVGSFVNLYHALANAR